jgi:hypothetical protein
MKKTTKWKLAALAGMYLLNSFSTALFVNREFPELQSNFEENRSAPREIGMNANPIHAYAIAHLHDSLDEKTFDALRYAHVHVANALDYRQNDSLDLEHALASGYGDCKDASLLTYMAFIDFAKEHNPAMISHVRIAKGLLQSTDTTGRIIGRMHTWLEFKKSGNWLPYDPTISINTIASTHPEEITRVDGNNVDPKKYTTISTYQLLEDSLAQDIHFGSLLTYIPGGFGLCLQGTIDRFSGK